MSRLVLTALFLAAAIVLTGETAAPRTPAQIRSEMTAIRRGTNWGDRAAAKEANERIARLAAELLNLTRRKPPEAPAGSPDGGDLADPAEGGVDPAKFLTQLTVQAGKAVGAGKQGDTLLGTKVREQIVEEYKADVDPAIKCPLVFSEQTTLTIDFSSPAAGAVVGQMENFRGIRTLILTGGERGAPADLPAVLEKARNYPLRELHIVNFRGHVTEVPPEVAGFAQLRVLALFGNAIAALPTAVGGLQQIDTLYVDANPIATVLPTVRNLPGLARLGVGATGVTAAERAEIERLLPDCAILTE